MEADNEWWVKEDGERGPVGGCVRKGSGWVGLERQRAGDPVASCLQ